MNESAASVVASSSSPAMAAKVNARSSAGLVAPLQRAVTCTPAGVFGVLALSVLIGVAALAPWLATYDPLEQHAGAELAMPSQQYRAGTDELGRDIYSRIVYGSRGSLLVGVVSVALASSFGISAGLAAGYRGGWLDALVMRACDMLLAFPAILLGIAVAVVLGPGVMNAAVALALVSIPQFARLTRASVLAEKERDYVQAARCLGSGDWRIVIRHVLPNAASPLLVQMSLAMAYAVLLEAGLSFLGLGTQPPEPSWGSMLNTSRAYLREAPWYGVFPGIALTTLILALNFLADALRDALDPRLQHFS